MRGLCDFTDSFVICHGSSTRQVLAISDAVEERLAKELGREPKHVEGRRLGEWVLMDYLDFVVHIFIDDKRRFYSLERLWGDAPRVDLDGFPRPSASKPEPARGRTPSSAR